MLPTKDNFPGRWKGTCCNVCGMNDTDEYLFAFPGFADILDDSVSLEMFFADNDLELLENAAEKMVKVIKNTLSNTLAKSKLFSGDPFFYLGGIPAGKNHLAGIDPWRKTHRYSNMTIAIFHLAGIPAGRIIWRGLIPGGKRIDIPI